MAEPGVALEPTPDVDPNELVLITNPGLPGGAVTTVPRRAFDGLWNEKGFVEVESDDEVVALPTGQLRLKDSALAKYATAEGGEAEPVPVDQASVKAVTADAVNKTTVVPGEVMPGSTDPKGK